MAGAYTPSRGRFSGQSFPSYRQYRNALARQHGFPSWYAQQRAPRPIRTPQAAAHLTPAEWEARKDALHALSLMRHGKPRSQLLREGRPKSLVALATQARPLSLAEAAKEAHTTPNTVLRYVGSALTKDTSGRYVARARDKLYRPMRFLTANGRIDLDVRDSRTARQIARYMNAVRRYGRTGRDEGLDEFRGKSIRVGGAKYEFVTDLDVLDRLADAGEISFEDLYADVT
jgi:hypothetical protein